MCFSDDLVEEIKDRNTAGAPGNVEETFRSVSKWLDLQRMSKGQDSAFACSEADTQCFSDLDEGQCLLEEIELILTVSFIDFYVQAKQSNFVTLQSFSYFCQVSTQNMTN